MCVGATKMYGHTYTNCQHSYEGITRYAWRSDPRPVQATSVARDN